MLSLPLQKHGIILLLVIHTLVEVNQAIISLVVIDTNESVPQYSYLLTDIASLMTTLITNLAIFGPTGTKYTYTWNIVFSGLSLALQKHNIILLLVTHTFCRSESRNYKFGRFRHGWNSRPQYPCLVPDIASLMTTLITHWAIFGPTET